MIMIKKNLLILRLKIKIWKKITKIKNKFNKTMRTQINLLL